MNMKLPQRRVDAGLPDGKVVRLIHNRVAGRTIVEVQPKNTPSRHRLFWRDASTATYRPLGAPTADESFECIVTCGLSVAFWCVVAFKMQGERLFADSIGICRSELRATKPSIEMLHARDLAPSGTWVTQILRATDAGELEVVAGFRNADGQGNVKYAVCSLDFDRKALVELDALPGIAF